MGWWNRLKVAVVEWLDFQPRAPYYTASQLEDLRLRNIALVRAARRIDDPLYEQSRLDRLRDNELEWPGELDRPIPSPQPLDYAEVTRQIAEFDGWIFDPPFLTPKEAAEYMDRYIGPPLPPLQSQMGVKAPRTRHTAKAPKKATRVAKKTTKPAKARTGRNKATPTTKRTKR